MRTRSLRASACSALAIALACGLAAGRQARAADEVTQERLLNPDKEQGNWLLHHHDYSAHHFSPLS
jgi:alcohol dehydrogenase (cytochrome c)